MDPGRTSDGVVVELRSETALRPDGKQNRRAGDHPELLAEGTAVRSLHKGEFAPISRHVHRPQVRCMLLTRSTCNSRLAPSKLTKQPWLARLRHASVQNGCRHLTGSCRAGLWKANWLVFENLDLTSAPARPPAGAGWHGQGAREQTRRGEGGWGAHRSSPEPPALAPRQAQARHEASPYTISRYVENGH